MIIYKMEINKILALLIIAISAVILSVSYRTWIPILGMLLILIRENFPRSWLRR